MSAEDFFDEGSGPVVLTSVSCTGNETSLLDCPSVVIEDIPCSTAGVSCQSNY